LRPVRIASHTGRHNRPLAAVLTHVAEAVLTGARLDPPGCGRVDLDNPPAYGDCYVTHPPAS